jgi:hypothetical protein
MANNIKNSPESQSINLNTVRNVSSAYGGLARSARFLVRIVGNPGTLFNGNSGVMRDLPYLCESAEFPTRQLVVTDVRYYGPNFKMPTQTNYQDLNLIFLCRNDFAERKFFDDWMEYINPTNTYDFSYKDDYAATIEIYQLSEFDSSSDSGSFAKYKFTFQKAYPLEVAAQPVTWADDNFHRLQVTFTFNKWYRETMDAQPLKPFKPVIGADTDAGKQITPRLYTPGTGTN